MSDSLPDFDVITDALRHAGSDSDAAECHGTLSGLLCTVSELDKEYWLGVSLPQQGRELSADTMALLYELFDVTQQQMQSEGFEFQLLLPDDNASLLSRVEILGNWCQGFLLGLSYGGMTNTEQLPGDLPEIVQDLVEISRADSFDVDESQDEADYAELVEYVRVSVLLFREELLSQASASSAEEPQLH